MFEEPGSARNAAMQLRKKMAMMTKLEWFFE
jgi:hypothetical protein